MPKPVLPRRVARLLFMLICCALLSNATRAQPVNKKRLIELLQRAEETHSEAVLVYQSGKLIAEKYYGIGKPETKIEAMSSTKSMVGLAVACMLADGMLPSLDVPVAKFYPEWRQGQKQLITVRHLVNMTSGLQNNPNAGIEIYPSPDFVQLALAAELSSKPGEVWSYNNKSLNLMAGVIKKATGQRMDAYIGQRLFQPLGITDFTWSLDSVGNPHVMSGCQIKPADFAKIGLLVLSKGSYNGKQVLPAEYVQQVLRPCEQYKGYGMLWWLEFERNNSVIDEQKLASFQAAGLPADFLAKARQLKGTYASDEEYMAKVQAVFGENPWDYIRQQLGPHNLKLREKEFAGDIICYRAEGYLGNYIVVDPKANVVAVRMISHASYQDEKDDFPDFKKRVLGLTK